MSGPIRIKSVLTRVGTLLKWLTLPLCIPLGIALIEGRDGGPFLLTTTLCLVAGWALERLEADPELEIREGFLVVALSWLGIALIGALPYILAGRGTLADPVNALFESMSGFTTTGATVLSTFTPGYHSTAILIWRQLSQWLGGMGIVVLGVAVLPKLSVGGSQLMEAEAPGPGVERLTPRIAQTAQRLWLLYVCLTLTQIGWLYLLHRGGWAPRMDLYNAVAHAFTTMPTGGFSPEGLSIAAFSPAVQWSLCPFIFLAGVNFALLWRAFSGRPGRLLRDRELWFYGAIIVLMSAVMSVLLLWRGPLGEVESAVRHGVFQVLSIITTTGYASADFAEWGGASDSVLFVIMFLGACAGSTGGGIKMVRWMVSLKTLLRELFTTIHPDALRPIRIGKRVIPEETVRGILIMVLFYLSLFLGGTAVIAADAVRVGLSTGGLELMSAVASCLGNIGPGFGAVGPMENYLPFSDFSKIVLVFLMWTGRLEILTVLIVLSPAYWQR